MKSSTNNSLKTVTAYEQKAGEATGFALVVKRTDGTVVRRPLLDPVAPPPPPPPLPSPVPVASVSVSISPTAINVGETARVTAVVKDIAGNILTDRPVTFSAGSTGIVSVDSTGLVTGRISGTTTVTATSEGVTGSAAIAVTVAPTPPPPPPPGTSVAEFPRSVPLTQAPAGTGTGTVRRVASGGDLQGALNAAIPGDVVLLAAGAVFTGEYTLPARKAGTGWITLRSDVTPATGRMTPTIATTSRLAKLIAPANQPALRTVSLSPPTSGWLIQDLEITGTLAQSSVQYGLLALGDGGWIAGGDSQDTLAKTPTGFILQRLYVHGSPTLNCTRGIALNSAQTAVLDSWVSEIHAAGFDSQAVCGWNGPGPFLVDNCHLSAAGENVMFGGADPGIPGLVPSDITFSRCHFPKPLSWKGGPWSVKNLFELKSALRVLLESSILEHCWPASQEGMAVVIKSNANGQQFAFEGSRDVTIRYCIVRDASVGLNLQAADDSYGWTGFTHVQRVKVEHTLFAEIGAEGRAALMLFTHDLKDIDVSRCTFVHAPTAKGLTASFAYSFGAAHNITFRDLLATAGAGYALFNDGGIAHAAALKAFASDGTATLTGSVIAGILPEYQSQMPTGNQYPSSLGLAADYSSSTYPTKGADIPELTRRTLGVVVQP